MWVLNHPFQVLQFLGTLAGPVLKFLIEKPLVLALDYQWVGLVILLDDETRLWLQIFQEELIKPLKIQIVFFRLNGDLPVKDIKEDLFQSIELLDVNEVALLSKKVVGIEDVRVELLCDKSWGKYQSI